MTAPKTVQYFGYYLVLVSATLIFAPNMLLSMLQIEETREPWIRIVGILVACLSVYYIRMGKSGNDDFAETSVYVRLSVLVSFVILAVMAIAPWQLVGFGVVDALAALWTRSKLAKN